MKKQNNAEKTEPIKTKKYQAPSIKVTTFSPKLLLEWI
jgi:hypothetical protein